MPRSKTGQLDKQLQRLHVVTALVFAALAIAAGWLMKPTSYPFVIGHATRDELASSNSTVFAPAVHHLVDIDMRWAVIVLMLLGLVTSFLALTHWRSGYVKQLENRLSPLTWISMGGILPALMFEIIAILSSAQDILYLKLMAGMIVLTGILGYLTERENRGVRRPQWLNFWLLFAVGALAWLALAAMMVATSLWGMVRLPWFAYGVFGVLTAASLAAVTNLWYELQNKKWARDFNKVERNYLLINLLAKGGFALVLIIGLMK